MSLDVYLELDDAPPTAEGQPVIYVREDGRTRGITRAEWDERFPGREPITVPAPEPREVFSANITHNLNTMADAAGIYQHLWRPDEIGITTAAELIEPLRVGLAKLEAGPARFRRHNPSNGWGTYEGLVEFVREYLAACEQYPAAKVRVWR